MRHWAWYQFALLFWVAACFFAAGARAKSIPMTRSVLAEVLQTAFIVVLVFALLTEGRGCTSGSGTAGADAALCIGDAHC